MRVQNKVGIAVCVFSMFVPSLLLPSHACLLTFPKHQYPFYFSITHTLSCCVFSTPLISLSPHTFRFYIHTSPICIYLCGWWPQQALANVSSATSSSLQPLMMRKPLLRHWCRVCRQSNRLKQTHLSCKPRKRERTERLIDWGSLKLSKKTCTLFLFCHAFSLYVYMKSDFCFQFIALLRERVPCVTITKQQWQRWKFHTMFQACEALGWLAHSAPVMTEATVGQELCEILWLLSRFDIHPHKITGPSDSLVNFDSVHCFEDATFTTTVSVMLQSTCSRNDQKHQIL